MKRVIVLRPIKNQRRGPINAGTGNKYQVETDFVGGPAIGLSLARYYNSADTTGSASCVTTAHQSGWQDARQFDAQEAQTLAHRNPALQQEGTNLIDDAGALADQPFAHPVQRLVPH